MYWPLRDDPMWSLLLFADSRGDPLQRPEVIWGVVGLTGALLAGAAVIYAVDRWRKNAAAPTTDAEAAGTLTSFRDMFENGEITEAEYAELRRRVADKVKKAGTPAAEAKPVGADFSAPPAPLAPPAGQPKPPEPPPPPPTV